MVNGVKGGKYGGGGATRGVYRVTKRVVSRMTLVTRVHARERLRERKASGAAAAAEREYNLGRRCNHGATFTPIYDCRRRRGAGSVGQAVEGKREAGAPRQIASGAGGRGASLQGF